MPITIRAGKALTVTATEVVVRFRRAPYNVFGFDIGATTSCGSGSGRMQRPDFASPARSLEQSGDRSCKNSRSPTSPAWTSGCMTGSSQPRSTAILFFLRGRTPSKPPGGSSTKFWVTSGLCTPIAPARGDRRKLMRSSLKATPGTIHLGEDARGALRRR